jgi:hypothetical protein
MRIIVLAFLILITGYYTLTYGISLWKDDKNRLGAVGAVLIAIIGTVAPIAFLFINR